MEHRPKWSYFNHAKLRANATPSLDGLPTIEWHATKRIQQGEPIRINCEQISCSYLPCMPILSSRLPHSPT